MILINRRDMTLVCKCQEESVIEKFKKLEATYVSIDEAEAGAFRIFTALEMRLLYRNLGSVPETILSDWHSVLKSIQKLLRYVPLATVSKQEFADLYNSKEATNETKNSSLNFDQPKGSISSLIWEVMDSYWIELNRPTDPKQILRLRKTVMDVLESDHNIKRTSASNELGKWVKARI